MHQHSVTEHSIFQKALGRVSLTVDAWSDPNLSSFLGTTAHFITREPGGQLKLRSGLLAFRHLQGSHTGEHLAGVFYKTIKGAGIERRVCHHLQYLNVVQTHDFYIRWARSLLIMQATMTQ